jgi:hypothetical protein
MNELALAQAIVLFTMDCIVPLEAQLWLSTLNNRIHKQSIRGLVERCDQKGTLSEAYPYLCASTYHFLNSNDANAWYDLYRWAECVFLYGDSRKAEEVWSLILIEHWRTQQLGADSDSPQLSRDVLLRLNAIELQFVAASGDWSGQIKSVMGGDWTTWDKEMCSHLEMTKENAADLLDGMCTCNAIVEAWRALPPFSLDELSGIYRWAMRRAIRIGIRPEDVAFPGSWEYRRG